MSNVIRCATEATAVPLPAPPSFDDVYESYATFVWRSVARLGVAPAAVEDVVQEIFFVVHRRLNGFEGRSSLKTWIFGITIGVVRNHRRSAARRLMEPVDLETTADVHTPGPDENAARAEAARLLDALLEQLSDEAREVFVMVELEEMNVPDLALALGINPATAHSRLRAARRAFEQALARYRARDEWRLR